MKLSMEERDEIRKSVEKYKTGFYKGYKVNIMGIVDRVLVKVDEILKRKTKLSEGDRVALEEWYIEYNMENFEENLLCGQHAEDNLRELCIRGFIGAEQISDKDLIEEYFHYIAEYSIPEVNQVIDNLLEKRRNLNDS